MLTVICLLFANLNKTMAAASPSRTGNSSANTVGQGSSRVQNDRSDGIGAIEFSNGIIDPNSDLSIVLATLTMTIGTIAIAMYRFKSREYDVS